MPLVCRFYPYYLSSLTLKLVQILLTVYVLAATRYVYVFVLNYSDNCPNVTVYHKTLLHAKYTLIPHQCFNIFGRYIFLKLHIVFSLCEVFLAIQLKISNPIKMIPLELLVTLQEGLEYESENNGQLLMD